MEEHQRKMMENKKKGIKQTIPEYQKAIDLENWEKARKEKLEKIRKGMETDKELTKTPKISEPPRYLKYQKRKIEVMKALEEGLDVPEEILQEYITPTDKETFLHARRIKQAYAEKEEAQKRFVTGNNWTNKQTEFRPFKFQKGDFTNKNLGDEYGFNSCGDYDVNATLSKKFKYMTGPSKSRQNDNINPNSSTHTNNSNNNNSILDNAETLYSISKSIRGYLSNTSCSTRSAQENKSISEMFAVPIQPNHHILRASECLSPDRLEITATEGALIKDRKKKQLQNAINESCGKDNSYYDYSTFGDVNIHMAPISNHMFTNYTDFQ